MSCRTARRTPRFDVTAFGEAMLRLSVPAGTRLETAHQLEMQPAVAEANVMAARVHWQKMTSKQQAISSKSGSRVGTAVQQVESVLTGQIGQHNQPPTG